MRKKLEPRIRSIGIPFYTRFPSLSLPMLQWCSHSFTHPSFLNRSLVSVVAHEIAHSWTGNLVTNATWEHFWLNEVEGWGEKVAGRRESSGAGKGKNEGGGGEEEEGGQGRKEYSYSLTIITRFSFSSNFHLP